ncbi:hypothetical protein AXF42_Ash015075 [Apostasia shenzhenica]|uniref:Uncharacterized protein n=1 Tax=Apostasia shenzhenica TaxID=1088818 RepID=A0A2I0B327_9ASPA|nr:hypothetical protein AXF42_Ash015075 [Apostasia shenzhenica]
MCKKIKKKKNKIASFNSELVRVLGSGAFEGFIAKLSSSFALRHGCCGVLRSKIRGNPFVFPAEYPPLVLFTCETATAAPTSVAFSSLQIFVELSQGIVCSVLYASGPQRYCIGSPGLEDSLRTLLLCRK